MTTRIARAEYIWLDSRAAHPRTSFQVADPGSVRPDTSGAVADYIPQLARVDPDLYGVALVTVDGQRHAAGDTRTPFSVQSCSKPVSYCLALEEHGEKRVHAHVGCEPSGHTFNELTLDADGRPHNPMINAGAIMSCSLIRPRLSAADRFDRRARAPARYGPDVPQPHVLVRPLQLLRPMGVLRRPPGEEQRLRRDPRDRAQRDGPLHLSPRLDANGNSVRGIAFSRELVGRFNFHNYDNLVGVLHGKRDPCRAGTAGGDLTDFYWAAASGDLEGIRRLVARGVKVDEPDYDGRTALHLAASEGHVHVVEFLLASGAARAAKDRWGNTPLDDAGREDHPDVAAALRPRRASA